MICIHGAHGFELRYNHPGGDDAPSWTIWRDGKRRCPMGYPSADDAVGHIRGYFRHRGLYAAADSIAKSPLGR